MSSLYRFLTTSFLIGCVVHGAHATDSVEQAPMVSSPQSIVPQQVDLIDAKPVIVDGDLKKKTDINGAIIAMPVDGWRVDSFVNKNGFSTNACVMKARYSNGVEVVFKGAKGQLSALRVKDTQKNKTDTIVKGAVSIGIGDTNYGLQSRSIQGQVDASLLTVPAPAERIGDVDVYSLRFGLGEYQLSTDGFKDAYGDLLKCQGYDKVATVKVVSEPKMIKPYAQLQSVNVPTLPVEPIDVMANAEGMLRDSGENVPLAMALPMIVPGNYTFKLDRKIDSMAPISWDMSDDQEWSNVLAQAIEPMGYDVDLTDKHVSIFVKPVESVKGKVDAQIVETALDVWHAKKGEKLSAVLIRWAKEAGVKAQIDLDDDPILTEDFSTDSSLDVAVDKILQATAGGKVNAVLDKGDGFVQQISQADELKQIRAPQSVEEPIIVPEMDPYRWRALSGTNLRKVLQRWSAKEDIQFIWDMDQEFFVKTTFKDTVDYNQAVASLLAQYDGQSVRPVASLNVDPKTGEKALLVKLK